MYRIWRKGSGRRLIQDKRKDAGVTQRRGEDAKTRSERKDAGVNAKTRRGRKDAERTQRRGEDAKTKRGRKERRKEETKKILDLEKIRR